MCRIIVLTMLVSPGLRVGVGEGEGEDGEEGGERSCHDRGFVQRFVLDKSGDTTLILLHLV